MTNSLVWFHFLPLDVQITTIRVWSRLSGLGPKAALRSRRLKSED
jgi:hypothetical protein